MAFRQEHHQADTALVDPANPWPVLNLLGRCEIEAALNWGGFATYDRESTDDLRRALALALAAGDIEDWQIGAAMDFAAAGRELQ